MKRVVRTLTFLVATGLTPVAFGQNAGTAQTARGVVTAARVNISTDIVAPIAATPFLEGGHFAKGDVLVSFNCGRYAADLRAAKASANAAWVELKQKRYLFKNGATGRSEMDLASAQSSKAAAEIEAISERMRSCTINAPFDGRVVDVNARAAELPQGGTPLLTILDESRIEIELVVPSRWLRHVRVGTTFDFLVEETGVTLKAHVDRLGAAVDPVSQTIQLYAVIDGDTSLVLAGMSGDARFDDVPATDTVTGALE